MKKLIFEVRSRGFVLLVIAFLIIAFLVYTQTTEQFDESSIVYFQSISGNPSLDITMWIFTEIGGIIPIMIFCFVMFVWRKTRRMGLILLLAVLVATVTSGYLKDYAVERPRPDLEYLGSELPLEIESDTTVLGGKGSFPSGTCSTCFCDCICFRVSSIRKISTRLASFMDFSSMYGFKQDLFVTALPNGCNWRNFVWGHHS